MSQANNSHISSALSVVAGTEPLPQVNPDISGHIRIRKRKSISVEDLANGIRDGNVGMLGRAITLVESSSPVHQDMAQELIERCLPASGHSVRVGITGIPGAGKSTFIEALGSIVASGTNKLAVLAVDPSSGRSGGSILGDKTRMEQLASNPNAFIRPSPSGNSLGGVARKTRETIILCEAAGYKTIFVETVGVGQSEIAVHSMTDFFLLLILPGAGDELQGMKRGIVEMADAILVNKADGNNLEKALVAKADYSTALHLLPENPGHWKPQVLTCSSRSGEGIPAVWELVQEYIQLTKKNNYFYRRRREQSHWWLKETISDSLNYNFYHDPQLREKLKDLKNLLEHNQISPFKAARELLDHYTSGKR
ncbi:MAG: methylmalonyl Co-A mutase-associated GTPase MeaB [Bacteroidales bacterium]